MKLCDYGCGLEAKFYFKTVKKWCCSDNSNKCLTIKNKISKSGKNKPHKYRKATIIENPENKLCYYGCGLRAEYELINKKLCCSDHFKKCQNMNNKGKNNPMYGKKHTIKTKRKMSESAKVENLSIETRKKMSKSQTGKVYSEEHKNKIRQGNLGQKRSIKTKEKLRLLNTGKNNPRYGKIVTIKQYKERYPTFAKVEEMRYNPDKLDKKEIQVHCKNHNCKNSKEQGGWFTLYGSQLEGRINAIEYGNDGNYFYCCEECKKECPLYNKKASQLIKLDQIKAGLIPEPIYTSEEYSTWRQEVFKRANYKCEYCGKESTHAHHIEPQKLQPGFILDPDNGLACCQDCHFKYGHKTGTECSTGNLAKTICT